MDSYLSITIPVSNAELSGRLVAELSNYGFAGFEETDQELVAYIDKKDFEEEQVAALIHGLGLEYVCATVQNRNWNEEWERNFQPVQIGDFCYVRASFHPSNKHTRYEIVITPKMSFGTGHHATTYMMIEAMEKLDLKNKSVLDFGCGTGILAILAAKCGATEVLAIDNDPLSIENLKENIDINECKSIIIELDSSIVHPKQFDTILANINRNTLLAHLEDFWQHLTPGGVLLMSGLLIADGDDLIRSAARTGFLLISSAEREGWVSLALIKG